MKLSDKLIILVVLGAFIIVGSAHLNIYARFKSGLSVINNRPTHKTYPAPAHLYLSGFTNITITPADSFAIEYEAPDAKADGPVRQKEGEYRQTPVRKPVIPWYNGDTLMMSGLDTTYPTGDKYQLAMQPTQSVHIYCPNIPSITVDGSLLDFNAGANAAKAFSASLVLKNVQLAKTHTFNNEGEQPREFDQLSITCINSRIDMQKNTHVRQLKLQLDSTSSAVILANVDSLSLQYHDASHLELSGAIFRHLSRR